MRASWSALGRLPASLAFAVLIGSAILASLLLPDDAARALGYALFAAWIVYCVARPARGLDVFFTAALPSGLGSILVDVLDWSRLAVVLPLTLLAFLLLLEIDRGSDDEDDRAVPSVRSPRRVPRGL